MDQMYSFHEGLSKAYVLIFNNYSTKSMQARIEEHPDFEAKIEDDAIKLLETIKTLMHDTVRAIYPVASITEALARLINIKQQEGEYLCDYVKQFIQLRDVTKSQIGKSIVDDYVERQDDYKKL